MILREAILLATPVNRFPRGRRLLASLKALLYLQSKETPIHSETCAYEYQSMVFYVDLDRSSQRRISSGNMQGNNPEVLYELIRTIFRKLVSFLESHIRRNKLSVPEVGPGSLWDTRGTHALKPIAVQTASGATEHYRLLVLVPE